MAMVSRRALRVLQVTTDDDRRGAQIFALDLEGGLRGLGHRVRTVALAPGMVGGLDVATLGRKRLHPRTLMALHRVTRGADAVIAHGSSTLPACALTATRAGVPFVYRQISDQLFWAHTPPRQMRVRWALGRAARVVALSDSAADTLVHHFGVDAARIDCIPNGVAPDAFPVAGVDARDRARRRWGIPGDGIVVAYVGALVAEKGVDTAIDAVALLADTTLVIAGDGPMRGDLERQAAALGERVRFTGSLDQPHDVYAAADVVVLPSRGGDTMPASLIEAGFVGRPSIATPVGAIPEIVRDGATGYIVPPNDPDALTAALVKLCADRETLHAFAGAANAYCHQRFSIDVVAAQWADTLDRAVQRPSARRTASLVNRV